MRHYELMVILDPDLEERTIAPSLDTFLNVVRKDGGSVEKVDVWGRRRLAVEIDKRFEGIYAVIDLSAEPATMKELDRQLNLNESILRTKVMRPELRASRPAPAKGAPAAAPTPSSPGAASRPVATGESAAPAAPASTSAPAPPATPAAAPGSVPADAAGTNEAPAAADAVGAAASGPAAAPPPGA